MGMHQKDIELYKIVIEFSYVLEVTPPKTTDIGHWWDKALKEMTDFWVFTLLENGAFTLNLSKAVRNMRQKLVEEAYYRNLVNTLA